MGELSGKAAIITGSTRGIGLAMAQLFAREGAVLVLNGRKRDALEEALQLLPAAIGVEGNVGDPAVVNSMVANAVEHYGHLDVAVANAATPGRPTPVTELEDDQWERSLKANLSGAFYLVRAAGRVMVEQGYGSIIVVGSIAGQRGLAQGASYSAAKAGLIGLVAAAAKDVGPAGVRVNMLRPSAATRAALSGWSRDELSEMTVMNRTGESIESHPDGFAGAG